MKTFSTRWIIPIFALAAISCTDEINLKDETIPEPLTTEVDEFIYPNSDAYVPLSRAQGDFNTNWENYEYYEFSNGDKMILPWGNEFVKGTQDKDVKKKDGWQMVTNNLHLSASETSDSHMIILHNRFSGNLKIFYFMPQGSILPNTKAIPSITFDQDHRQLNSVNEVTIPSTRGMGLNFKWHTTLQGKPFLQNGWNVMVVPITYDPYPVSNLYASIDFSRGLLVLNANLIGDAVSHTTGTISFAKDSKGNIFKSVLNIAGNIIGSLLSVDNETTQEYVELPESVAPKFLGIGSILKSAINFISGTLFGKGDNTQHVEYTTKSTLELKGEIYGDLQTGGDVKNLQLDKFKTGVELGVWNLYESPTMYMHPIGVMTNAPLGLMSDENDYTFRPTNKYKVSVAINPQLKPYIKSYTVECFPVVVGPDDDALYTSTVELIQLGALSNRSKYTSYGTNYLTKEVSNDFRTVYDGIPTETWTTMYLWQKYGKPQQGKPIYKYVWGPNHDDVFRGDHKVGAKNLYLKVCLVMEVEYEGQTSTIYSARTYMPKIDWDPDYISRFNGCTNIEAAQHFGSIDPLINQIDNHAWDNLRDGGSLLKVDPIEEDVTIISDEEEKAEE